MDIVKLLLDRLLSWPFLTFLAVLLFRKTLSALGNRIHTLKAGKEGFTLDASAATAAIQAEMKVEDGLKPSEADQRFRQASAIVISPSVQWREARIRADLQTMKLDANKQETVDLLIRHLAAAQARAAAELTYRTIFGSQIALLKSVNINGPSPQVALEAVYGLAKSRFPELYANYSFQQWLQYLQSMGLIETNNGQFSITVDGKEFLKWMTDASVKEDKPF